MVSIKLWNYLVSDNETQANTILVDVSRALNESKKLKKLLLIIDRYTDACVNDWNLKILIYNRHIDGDRAFFSELKGIWLKT